jgi:hypothetical protein
MKRLTLMIILAVLVCLICGCEAKDPNATTTPTTTAAPTETTPILQTEPVTEPTTEPTIPVETTVPVTAPIDPDALSTEEIEALEAVYTTHESLTFCFPRNWYNATLGQEFDSPEDLNVNRFFTHPGAVIPLENYELTDAEIDFLMTFQHMHGIFQTETDVYRLPKADAEFLLKWYFDLELENADMTEVYWEETDCYYFASEPGGVLAFEVLEAEYIDDDLIWFRYRDARSHSRPEYEAVIRVYRERFVILSNKVAE